MNLQNLVSKRLLALATAVLLSAGLTTANATEPCGDFGWRIGVDDADDGQAVCR